MKKNISILSIIVLAVFVSLFFVSCNKKDKAIFGSWQLIEFCYGSDCSNVTDHDIVQIWQFNDDAISVESDKPLFSGRQYQENIMDNEILWSLSKKNDTLFTTNSNGDNADIFLVQRLDKDTMILSSMMNNILVQQLFVKAEN